MTVNPQLKKVDAILRTRRTYFLRLAIYLAVFNPVAFVIWGGKIVYALVVSYMRDFIAWQESR